MRYFLKFHIFTILSSLVIGILLYNFCYKGTKIQISIPQGLHYMPSFNNNEGNEIYAGQMMENKSVILMGSSELSSTSEAVPHHFFPRHSKNNFLAIGHMGNQDFSIFTQLLANSDVAEGAKIVIIISPGWLAGKSALGTTLPVLLENNSPRFFDKIAQCKVPNQYIDYVADYLYLNQPDISHASLGMRFLTNRYKANSNLTGMITHYPLLLENRLEESLIRTFHSAFSPEKTYLTTSGIDTSKFENTPINWDSLIESSGQKAAKNATNNSWGINNDYFNKYVGGKKAGRFSIPSIDRNREYTDLVVLLDFLQEKKCHTGFVIQPMNPFYYAGLPELQPTIDSVVQQINKHGFDVLNLFCSDSTNYDKSMLNDVMHLGDAGWYRVDRYIYEKYFAYEKN